MYGRKEPTNQEKLNYLEQVLQVTTIKDNKQFRLYYSLHLLRFGSKIPVLNREPASSNITMNVEKFSSSAYKPDFIIVEIFTGRSRQVKKPIAVIKLNYKAI